jgi:integrase
MPKQAKPLSAAKVRTAEPGRHFDGDGLVLLVRKADQKTHSTEGGQSGHGEEQPDRAFWLFRYSIGGKIREAGLGRARGHNAVTLAEARERARRMRDKLREGKDPLTEREAAKAKAKADSAKARAAAITFAQVAALFIAAHEAGWRSDRHRQQWRNTLDQHVLPTLGALPVGNVGTAELMAILEPLWRTRTETASRVRGRIESVLDYAKARGWREGENPARWRGHLSNLLPQRSKMKRVEHHAALGWRSVGDFMQRLRQNTSISARALELTILTAARSGEVRGAKWSEIDLDHAVWTVPAERMKAEREHRVPLSDAALAVLRTMAEIGVAPNALVFPSRKAQVALSDKTLASAVDSAGGNGATVHGFRSTFRDWAGETTAFPREVIEMCLAHRLGDAAEQAYARGDLFQKRAALMEQWGTFCAKLLIVGNVLPFVRAAAAG